MPPDPHDASAGPRGPIVEWRRQLLLAPLSGLVLAVFGIVLLAMGWALDELLLLQGVSVTLLLVAAGLLSVRTGLRFDIEAGTYIEWLEILFPLLRRRGS